jgi:RNA 2',3'-cyclic 3'-phosphodiesterase
MRLFIGAFLPEETKKEVTELQQRIAKLSLFNGKSAEEENLHLTLKFLGEVKEEKLPGIKEALGRIKQKTVGTKIEGAGIFTPSRPRIVWLQIRGFEELQKKIDEEMEGVGFKKEERFMSHITISRIKHITPINARKLLEELQKIAPGKEAKVKKFALIESELTPKGPKYKIVEEYKLA